MYKFTVVSLSIVCKITKSVHSTVKGALIGICTHTVQSAFIQFCTNKDNQLNKRTILQLC